MNCPYCNSLVEGITGLQELHAFEDHLKECQKNPNNVVLTDGVQTAVTPKERQRLADALRIRAESGQ